jgi:hypothetical protein
MYRRISLLFMAALLSACGMAPPAPSPQVAEVGFGTALQFGEVARVCEVREQDLGKMVEEPVARGYRLFDSQPGSAGPRSFYITGFADDCARQLTAANVLFGTPSVYEQLHYGPAGENLPTAETDAAYEAIKANVCGAGKGKPCGKRIGTLDDTAFFVSAYERLGQTARWSEVLVHDGAVAAVAMKSAN